MTKLTDTHIRAAVDLCKRVVAATDGPEPSAEAMGSLLGALRRLLGTPEPLEALREQWVVFYGGPDPENFAGRVEYGDRAEAEEMQLWIRESGVAYRNLYAGPWEVTDHGQAR